jgi:hypothetical protein
MTQAFVRPIEITSSNDSFSIAHDSGAAQNKVLTNGVYSNIYTLIREFEETCQTEDPDFDIYLDSNHKLNFDTADAQTNEFVFQDEALAELLGFGDTSLSGVNNDTLADANEHTADYTPAHCWLPTYQSADREYWGRRQSDAVRGTIAQNGRLSAITTGDTLYYRDFTFQFETAVKTYRSADTTTSETIDTTAFFYTQRRCYEEFMEQCRQVQPTVSGNPSPKGFYYIPDRTTYEGVATTYPTNMTSGGVDFLQSSGADTYVYCHPDVAGGDDPRPALENNRDYYEIRFTAHTATAPTFATAA